jgi:hypothetical protein
MGLLLVQAVRTGSRGIFFNGGSAGASSKAAQRATHQLRM